jgi:hypothetical protein
MKRQIKKQKQHICLVKWRKRLANAGKRGHFTQREVSFASSWNVCAVGEGKSQLTKANKLVSFKYNSDYGQLAPIDKRLETLGIRFVNQVIFNDFKGVARTLNTIEERLNKLYVLV